MVELALLQPLVKVNDTWIDYFIIGVYFVFVLGIGALLRSKMRTSEDYFLSGRSLPSWITGLAFLGANLGALEIMGMGRRGCPVRDHAGALYRSGLLMS